MPWHKREDYRIVNHFRSLIPILGLLPVGCHFETPVTDAASETEESRTGSAFDVTKTGSVSGRVLWKGAMPNTPDFLYGAPRADGLGFEFRNAKNPNRPRIDTKTRGLADAVVFVRNIDPAVCKPWDLPDSRVELVGSQIEIVQGEHRGNIGFVRKGTRVGFSSMEQNYHVIRGRGDAFFGMTLPERDRLVTRMFPSSGRIELSSGSGLYWARAYLFVADHPYFTVTDADGRFTLDHVPTGKIELVVWHPNWAVERQERDADSTIIVRQTYAPPLEKRSSVTIDAGARTEFHISLP